jgi:hypothetical protein
MDLRCADSCEDHCLQRHLEVRVLFDYYCVVSPKLKQYLNISSYSSRMIHVADLPKSVLNNFSNLLPNLLTPSKAHYGFSHLHISNS